MERNDGRKYLGVLADDSREILVTDHASGLDSMFAQVEDVANNPIIAQVLASAPEQAVDYIVGMLRERNPNVKIEFVEVFESED